LEGEPATDPAPGKVDRSSGSQDAGPGPADQRASTAEPYVPASADEVIALNALIEQGISAEKGGDMASARLHFLKALALAEGSPRATDVEGRLASVSILLLTTPRQMKEKVDYTIRGGDNLRAIAGRHGTTLELVQASNGISDPNKIRRGDRLRLLNNASFSIEVRKRANDLVLKINGEFVKRYSVGTGKFGKTPVGTYKIAERIAEPVWWRSDGRAIAYGEAENILGTRWMKLKASGDTERNEGYGIHGTWDEGSIGQQSSAGCIRMRNADVEELYMIVPNGTAVTIAE